MPEPFSANVAAANNEQPEYNFRFETYVLDPGFTNADSVPVNTVPLGSVMILEATAVVPDGDGKYTPAYVTVSNHSSLTFTFVGVLVGGSTLGQPYVSPGGLCMIAVQGLVQALYDDNSTTQGHLALQSAANDGMLTDSATATVGKTVGFIDQTKTIGAAGVLVWTYVGRM